MQAEWGQNTEQQGHGNSKADSYENKDFALHNILKRVQFITNTIEKQLNIGFLPFLLVDMHPDIALLFIFYLFLSIARGII